jgi:hypothetical protein
VDGTDSDSCPVAGFGISGHESSGSAVMIVDFVIRHKCSHYTQTYPQRRLRCIELCIAAFLREAVIRQYEDQSLIKCIHLMTHGLYKQYRIQWRFVPYFSGGAPAQENAK